MSLSEFSHSSMFHCDLPGGDYVSPGFFGLMDQTNELDNSMESLLDYSNPLTRLLPVLEYQNIESGGSVFEPVVAVDSPTRSTGKLLHCNKPVSKYDNECNYPSWYYSTSSNMASFDRLGKHGSKLAAGVPDHRHHDADIINHGTGVIAYNSEEAAMEDRRLEEQLRWLYSGDNLEECDGLLGAALKRPSMAMDEVQVSKKHCTGTGMKKKSGKPTVCKDPQSIAAKNRRGKIRERLKVLQELVPKSTKVDLVTMLEKSISYVKFLQLQVKVLETDGFWAANGGKALAEVEGEEKEAIDAILSSHIEAGGQFKFKQRC